MNHIVDACPLTKMKADWINSTKRMTTQWNLHWNLQRLQHSRNNNTALLVCWSEMLTPTVCCNLSTCDSDGGRGDECDWQVGIDIMWVGDGVWQWAWLCVWLTGGRWRSSQMPSRWQGALTDLLCQSLSVDWYNHDISIAPHTRSSALH